MEQININYSRQDSQSRASSVIPANYDDLEDQLQAALTRIAALEGNLEEECQARQQAEANAAQQLQQNIQAQITG